jgi:flagellin
MIPNTTELTLNGVTMIFRSDDDPATVAERLELLADITGFDFDLTAGVVTLTARDPGAHVGVHFGGNNELMDSLGLGTVTDLAVVQGLDREMEVTAPPELVGSSFTFEGDHVTLNTLNGQQIFFRLGNSVANGDVFSIFTRRGPLTMQVGTGKNMGLHITIPRVNARTIGIDRADVTSVADATSAIRFSDTAIAVVSSIRSRLGAYQNRLEHTVANLDNAHTNASQSLSRIVDTDMAHEMTEYSKNNVIYQAGIAILAQSNARPQSLLQLLQ